MSVFFIGTFLNHLGPSELAHEERAAQNDVGVEPKKQMIIRVCRFLSEEYNFIRLHNVDNCKLAPLAGITSRAAQATGVTPSYISRIYAPYKERDAALSLHSGLSTKHVKQKGRVTKEAIDTIPVLKDIKTEPNSDSDENTATKKPLLCNAYGIKQESADNEKGIPSFEPEMPNFNQQIIHITQEPSDNKQERPSIAQEIKQEVQDIKQESSDNKQETSSITQEILYIKQETTVNELEEVNTEIDFEKKIPSQMLMNEELKMEKLSSSTDNLRNAKVKSKNTNFLQLHQLYVPSQNINKNAILGTANKTKLMDHGEPSSPSMEQAEYRFPPVTKQYTAKKRIKSIVQQNLQFEDTDNTHRLEISTVTDLNQKRRWSCTSVEQEHEISPGCSNVLQTLPFEDEVQGKNTEPNLDQILQVDNDAEKQKKEENDLLLSNKFEEVPKFENKQEFEAVSRFCDAKIEKFDTMIARVYLFIKDEYQFMKTYNVDNCNLSPLHNCTERAAKATGVNLRDVKNALARTKALQQRKQQIRTYKPKKRKQDDLNIVTDNKTIKLNTNIDYKDSHTNVAGSHSSIMDMTDRVNVDNATDINRKAGCIKKSTRTEKEENEMPPVCRNLRDSLQFENEIKEEITETFNTNNSTCNTQEKDLPSTFIEQEDHEMLPLSNRYTENDKDEGLYQRYILQFEDEDIGNSDQGNVDTETFIIQEVEFPSPSIKQEENELTSLYETYTINEQGVAHSRNLNQILQVDAEHLTSTKKGENDSFPSDKFEANVIGVLKFEEEREVEAVSYMEQDCFKLEPKIEKVDVSETSVSEQFNCYENLPSSSGNINNIFPKANETEDIEFVCIKNEFHSDSSHE